MKGYMKLLVGVLLIVLLAGVHLEVRPRMTVSLNGSCLSDCDVIVVGGGRTRVIHLDGDGAAYLGYTDIGKQLVVVPDATVAVKGTLDGLVTKVTTGHNIVKLTDGSE